MNKKRVIRWSIPALWLVLVLFLSGQPGDDSNRLSLWLAEHLLPNASAEDLAVYLRLGAHIGIHFVLAILIYWAAYYDTNQALGLCCIICIFVSVNDELLQCFVPGRSFEFIDIVLNLTGMFVALILCKIATNYINRPPS